jgi:hypothetical protein
MGLFDWIGTKEKRTQLYFRDDGKFMFRSLELEDAIMVTKKDDSVVAGWEHHFNNQFPFTGLKGIPADMVTLGYSRDTILDPYGLVEREQLGKGVLTKLAIKATGKQVNPAQPWLAAIGHARRLKIMAKRGKQSSADKIIWILGSVLILEVIGILIKFAQGYGK